MKQELLLRSIQEAVESLEEIRAILLSSVRLDNLDKVNNAIREVEEIKSEVTNV